MLHAEKPIRLARQLASPPKHSPGRVEPPKMACLDFMLRYTIAQFPFTQAGMTTSIGVAVFPEDGTSVESLLAVADKRLYEAKRLGCNQVVGPK